MKNKEESYFPEEKGVCFVLIKIKMGYQVENFNELGQIFSSKIGKFAN